MLKRIQYNAPVTLSFSFLSLAVLLLGIATKGLTTNAVFCTYWSSFRDPFFYVRLFTHVLGHSGWEHYFGNIMYILLLGPILEEKYGSRALLDGFILTAFVTGVAHVLLSPTTALLGASGIVFMLILLASFASFREGRIPLTFILIAGIYIGNEVVKGISSVDNISQLSHIIGGLCGALLGVFLNKTGARKRR